MFLYVSLCKPTQPFRVNEAEKQIEQIKVTESRAYIESVLGVPNQTETFNYISNDGNCDEGMKAVFNDEFFLLGAYFDKADRCLGYILIAKDPKFSPKLFRDERLFEIGITDNSIDEAGYLAAIGHFLNSRADCSSYHIQYYYHHLATNNCYLGMGISELGYWQDNYSLAMLAFNEKTDLSKADSYYEIVTNDTRSECMEKCKEFNVINPNTFSVFLADNSLDVDALLKEELRFELGLSWIDYRRITE